MKKLLTSMVIMFVFLLMGNAFAQSEITIIVDDEVLEFPDQQPVLNEDGRILVPVRTVGEALGMEVEWVEESKQATLTKDLLEIVIMIGEKRILATAGTPAGHGYYQFVTTPLPMDTPATIINERVMIPLRFISETMGAKVEWNAASRTVFITTKAQE